MTAHEARTQAYRAESILFPKHIKRVDKCIARRAKRGYYSYYFPGFESARLCTQITRHYEEQGFRVEGAPTENGITYGGGAFKILWETT